MKDREILEIGVREPHYHKGPLRNWRISKQRLLVGTMSPIMNDWGPMFGINNEDVLLQMTSDKINKLRRKTSMGDY